MYFSNGFLKYENEFGYTEKLLGQCLLKKSRKMGIVNFLKIVLFVHWEFARYISYAVNPILDLSVGY